MDDFYRKPKDLINASTNGDLEEVKPMSTFRTTLGIQL